MATFEVRVEGLTGLSIDASSSPTQDELTEYLKDGVIDVTQRCVQLNPKQTSDFTRSTSEATSNGGLGANIGDIMSVVREAGTDGDWRECKKIPLHLQSRVTDIDSLHYASKFHPAYITGGDGAILTFPVPASGGADSYKLYYVNDAPVNSSDSSLIYSHSDINYFPQNRVYLVVMYAGIKALQNALANKGFPNEALSFSMPIVPADANVSFTDVGTIKTFTPPVFVTPSLGSMASMSLPSPPVAPTLSSSSISFSTTAPTFEEPTVSPDFADAENWINTEEDSEMLSARVQLIGSELQKYNTDIQKSMQKMNNENLEYQAQLQKSIQDAQLGSQDDGQKLQKYSSDVQNYTSQVNKEVNRWTNEIYNKTFNEWRQDYEGKLQEYNTNLQKEMQEVTLSINDFQAEVQKAIQTYQSETGYDLQKYQAEVTTAIQKYTYDIQNYTQQVQKVGLDYGWMEKRMMKLQQEYDSAFAIMAPQSQAPQQQRQGVR